jgi:outer membrane lipoprotein
MSVVAVLLGGVVALSSCAESIHQVQPDEVPSELERQIDSTVTFADLQTAPQNFVGRVVRLGGIVIAAKRKQEETELEVLQLPIKADGPSVKERLRSEGRFLAVQEEFLDPASVPAGTPITVVGTVKGDVTRRLDETEYLYPVLEIKHLTDWNAIASQNAGGGAPYYYGPYYGYGSYFSPYGYWGAPYGFYPFFARPNPFFFRPRVVPPPIHRPPPSRIPPQFRKR